MNLLIRHALGIRRVFGDRVNKPLVPSALSSETRVELMRVFGVPKLQEVIDTLDSATSDQTRIEL